MMDRKEYYVYILTNSHHIVLYTGLTDNLQHRVGEHKIKTSSAFKEKYNVDKPVYFECDDDVNQAIFREQQIKAGSRQKKIDLINEFNPDLKTLYDELY